MNKITEDGVGVQIASDAQTVVGFHGATRRPQRAGAIQAVVTATVSTNIAEFTDPPSAAEMALLRTFVNALKTDNAALIVLVNELRAALTEKGLIKGAA